MVGMMISIRKVFFLLFAAASMLAAGSMNSQKIDGRLLSILEGVQNHTPVLQKSFLLKYSGSKPMYPIIVFARSIDNVKALGIQPMSFNGTLFTAYATYDQISQLSFLPDVSKIDAPKMRYPLLDKSIVEMKVNQLHAGTINGTKYTGKGVIIGVIDTGIDWKHQDFRSDSDTTQSRILSMWDQTDSRTGMGPNGYNYGAEYTQTQIDDELDGTPAGAVLEEDLVGHGTHVAGIAAGDGSTSNGLYTGVAPEADLIIVKAGDDGFATNNIIDGITYIRKKAEAAGKPFVINMSLGSHDGAHDGTSQEEVAVNAELQNAAGRQIVIAAGNEGSDPIHADSSVAQGQANILQFTIPSYSANAGTQNDYVILDMWYNAGDDLTVTITTPNNTNVTAASNQSSAVSTAQGRVRILNASSGVDPSNGDKECYIEISDIVAATPPASGTWKMTITGVSVKDGGTYDVWIAGASMADVAITSGETFRKLVGMPGTGEKSITVGAYATKWSWKATDNQTYSYTEANRVNNFCTFSSMGPTRDGRLKPDVSAPGQAIASALSSASSPDVSSTVFGGGYVIEQGTSMASPHVAGLVALLLQANPGMTAAQIRSVINTTARKDSLTGAAANPQWGYGKADAVAAMEEVLSVERISSIVPSEFELYQNYPNPFNPSTKISFTVPRRGIVTLKVFSILGKEVATLVNEDLGAGEYSSFFDAHDLSSGVYFYTLRSGGYSVTKKMLLLR